jgi:hypothetical protein
MPEECSMKFVARFTAVACVATIGLTLFTGCKKEEAKTPTPAPNAATPATQPLIPVAQVADWCPEHGVPESVCTRCNESLIAGFQAKNDWCKEHKRPESQCFICHPDLQEKFAAVYKEKYKKDPPPVEKD